MAAFIIGLLAPLIVAVAAYLISSYIKMKKLNREFEALEKESLWVFSDDINNPFAEDRRVMKITDKRIGPDGKTKWVSYKSVRSNYTSVMNYETFRSIYYPLNKINHKIW